MVFSTQTSVCVFISGDVISGLPRSHVHSGPDPFYADKISICHVTHMRLSDWSLFEMRPSDWLCPKPPPYTTLGEQNIPNMGIVWTNWHCVTELKQKAFEHLKCGRTNAVRSVHQKCHISCNASTRVWR